MLNRTEGVMANNYDRLDWPRDEMDVAVDTKYDTLNRIEGVYHSFQPGSSNSDQPARTEGMYHSFQPGSLNSDQPARTEDFVSKFRN